MRKFSTLNQCDNAVLILEWEFVFFFNVSEVCENCDDCVISVDCNYKS